VNRTPQLSQRRRLAVLAICCSSLLMVAMDNTIVNVALPSIGHELRWAQQTARSAARELGGEPAGVPLEAAPAGRVA
jgi:hypothetical protein